ncbi:Serine/threonine protein Kinase [Phytophthora cinnamomi]|uniref:Serine/threonine protein Kinase n=1 Tax=Phytophthora cinnamomi TaxID=4785 RepID=UPI003559FA77|nr:Serine/threonine protein Kinase [Phytophthora cinnamomi]
MAGAESSEDFGDTADKATTPGGLNEQVHRTLQGNGSYGLIWTPSSSACRTRSRAQLNGVNELTRAAVFVEGTSW